MSEEKPDLNDRLKTQPDDDDLSSAGLIQRAIDGYEESSKKSSVALPPTREISFFPSTTPQADKYRRSSTSQFSTATVTPNSVSSSSLSGRRTHTKSQPVDEERISYGTNNDRVRIKNEHNVQKLSYPSTNHKQHYNNEQQDDDEVQLMKVERKRASCSSDQKSTKLKKHRKDDSQYTLATLGLVDPAPPLSVQPICISCGNKGYMCHHYQFSGYCTKACMSYLQTNREGWEAGFNVETMERIFYNAYNEARRVTFEERFGYYNPRWVEIPSCMKTKALHIAVDLGFNTKLCSELRDHNENAKKKYEEAQGNYRA